MSLNPGGMDILGVPLQVVAIGVAIVLFVVGFVWLRRITRDPDHGDEHWRFRR